MFNILIAEDIPSDNKGEAALFYGIIKSLRVLGDITITMLSHAPERDRSSYKDSVFIVDASVLTPGHTINADTSKLNKLFGYGVFFLSHFLFVFAYITIGEKALAIFKQELWLSYAKADLVILAHDSFYTPYYHGTLIFLLGRILRKKVMVYGASIIPADPRKSDLDKRFRNYLNKLSLKFADAITLREEKSYSYIKCLDIDSETCQVAMYPDLAFITDPASDDEIDDIMRKENVPSDRLLVGMAISQRELAYALPGSGSKAQSVDSAISALSRLIDHLTKTLGATVVFVPHAIGPTPLLDDRISADWIKSRCASQDKVIVMRGDYDCMQLKGLAARMHMTIGTRLHFAIDSVCMNVPAMLITHDGEFRCRGIFGDMLKQDSFLYLIDDINTKTLINMANNLWANNDDVRKELSQMLPGIKQDVMRHAYLAKSILVN